MRTSIRWTATYIRDPGTNNSDPRTDISDPGTNNSDPSTNISDPGTNKVESYIIWDVSVLEMPSCIGTICVIYV